MAQHYTSLTLEESAWCKKCSGFTPHAVSGNVLGHCLKCADKAEAKRQQRLKDEAEAQRLRDQQEAFTF